ncbi:MAG: type II secretion system F family protein [Gammaproteobacteria bacterium]|nr:type II secretion system F family protein [Gammaproteobacteria bacterium]MCW8922358.1 type II secretion system F family protein [Gammaproteobacteria bacterium]
MAKAKTATKATTATFSWEGTNKQGKAVKGITTAASIDAVKAELRKQGVTAKPGKIKKQKKKKSGKKITPADIAVFSRQLATMMKAGVPLVQSFDIVGQGHSNPSMAELIMKIKASVEAGNTLAAAMAEHPLYFDALFINLVDAGEQSGALEELLDKVATYKEKTEALKAKIKKALTYPISVLVVAMVVTVILLVFVVPTFSSLFEGFGAELPEFTQMVVNMSEFMISDGWIVGMIIASIIIGISQLKKRSRKFNENLDKMYLKLPIVSGLTHSSAVAKFSRTLSTMFAAGVPLVDAMVSVAGASGNIVYKKAILNIRDEIAQGSTLQASLSQSPDLFPNMLIQMVGIGEESGALDEMLSKVADYFEAAVDDAVDNMTALMEPIIMSFLAVVIGGLVIAMYLPVFKMGEVVQGH